MAGHGSARASCRQAGTGSLPWPAGAWIATWSAPASRWERRPAAMLPGGAVGHERVDQAVAAAVVGVGVGVAVASRVAGVVGELEIGVGHGRAAGGAGPAGVGVQDDRVPGAMTAPGPGIWRAARVWSGTVRYRWVPGVRSAARCRALGPGAARIRRPGGTPPAPGWPGW